MATKPNIIDFAKAVRDEISEDVRGSIRSDIVSVCKLLREEIDGRVQDKISSLEFRISSLEGQLESGLERIYKLLQALPTPVVNVSVPKQELSPVFNIKNPEPVVNVSVPRQETPIVNVSVPQQEAPVVNVNIPEQETPVVNVTVPPPRKVSKKVEFDAESSEWRISEEDVE